MESFTNFTAAILPHCWEGNHSQGWGQWIYRLELEKTSQLECMYVCDEGTQVSLGMFAIYTDKSVILMMVLFTIISTALKYNQWKCKYKENVTTCEQYGILLLMQLKPVLSNTIWNNVWIEYKGTCITYVRRHEERKGVQINVHTTNHASM